MHSLGYLAIIIKFPCEKYILFLGAIHKRVSIIELISLFCWDITKLKVKPGMVQKS